MSRTTRWADGFSAIADKVLRPRKNIPDTGFYDPNEPLPTGALIAGSGGWCAPTETVFDLSLLTMPEVQVKRGGIDYNTVQAPVPVIPPAPRPFKEVGTVWAAYRDNSYDGNELLKLCVTAEDARAACEDDFERDRARYRYRQHEPGIEWQDSEQEGWQEGWASGDRYFISTESITTMRNREDSE